MAQPEKAEEGRDDKANILIVDDLPEKLLVFQTILEDLGQNLVMVRSGSEALREVLEREFAVILLDVNMPDIDGFETAALIRRYKRSAHTPIIFITAYADEMQTAQGYSLGAVDYILSPILPEVLRSKVKVFVDLYQMQQRTRLMAEERVARAEAEAARNSAEEATRRANFLASASRELGASLDLEAGMRRLLELVVPQMADAAVAVVHAEEGGETALARFAEGDRWSTQSLKIDLLPSRVTQGLRRAEQEARSAELNLAAKLRADEDASTSPLWPQELRAALAVPFRIGERSLGAMLLATRSAFPAFGARDEALLVELGSRAAMAFDNAALYRSLKRESTRSREAEERLQDANRRKDEFLAMLSHELRNPLAPIRNAVEVIRRAAPPDPTLGLARDIVDRQVQHLTRLVEELLDVSRISQGKIVLKKEPVELGKVIAHSLETARPLIESRGQLLTVHVSQKPVWLFGDFARLAQVVGNLLNNAAKYTQEGGRIELSAEGREGEALIVVRDDGAGIDPKLLPQVFELFVQGDRSLDRAQGGLGVGLTLVRRLAELHQGRVDVHSEGPGKGSTFKVVLPCVSEVPHGRETQHEAGLQKEARRHRVLVVDDNLDAAESIAAYLRMEGHEVKAVSDGYQALASAQVFAPQVVVLDIGLPGLDGYAVAKRLRAQDETREALLVALTGYGQKEDVARAMEAGFDAHYVKPADPRQIQIAIECGRKTGPTAMASKHLA